MVLNQVLLNKRLDHPLHPEIQALIMRLKAERKDNRLRRLSLREKLIKVAKLGVHKTINANKGLSILRTKIRSFPANKLSFLKITFRSRQAKPLATLRSPHL